MNDAVAAVHTEDVEKARQFLQGAITQAGEAWLPSEAIVDALTLELIEMAGRHGNPAQAATHLMQVAALLRHTQARSH